MRSKSHLNFFQSRIFKVTLLFFLLFFAFIIISICKSNTYDVKEYDLERIAHILNKDEIYKKEYDLEQIAQNSYDSLVFSMYSVSNYDPGDFIYYFAWTPIISTHSIRNLQELDEYLNSAFTTDNQINNVYLGLDPYAIWLSSDQEKNIWENSLNKFLFPYFAKNPSIYFAIYLPNPSLDYWLSLSEQDMDTALKAYRDFITLVETYSNVDTYFMGAETWLIANPAYYEDYLVITSPILRHNLLYSLYRSSYMINSTNMKHYFESLADFVSMERMSRTDYPDLSQWHILIFGDSIMGNYDGITSAACMVNGLSGASVYNYAINGTYASEDGEHENAFPSMVREFLEGTLSPSQYSSKYLASSEVDDAKNLCILIHYGLNDYFGGHRIYNSTNPYDENTFIGALRSGIKKLKETYPQAMIILITPSFCTYFSYGTESNGEEGEPLTAYVDAVINVANAENVFSINNYTGLGINADNYEDYLEDGCHFNEMGRFLLGSHIIFTIEDFLNQNSY